MRLTVPSIPSLRDTCASSDQLLISAPFYSKEGLGWVQPADGGEVEFWTRLNPHDWAMGVSDPPALLDYLERVGEERVTLRVHRALHAKIYMAGKEWSWIGSANLSRAAFEWNVELVAELDAEETSRLTDLAATLREGLTEISLDDLRNVIAVAEDAVRRFEEAEVSEDLLAAVQLVDEVMSPPPRLTYPERIPDLANFIGFVQTLRGAIVQIVLAHHFNTNNQNRQGHVKQSYYAIALFLSDPRGRRYVQALRAMSLDGYPDLPPSLINDWVSFLDENATHRDAARDYSFSTLRNILPERVGGYTTGGGGASGTWTRMFPLVAHFMND